MILKQDALSPSSTPAPGPWGRVQRLIGTIDVTRAVFLVVLLVLVVLVVIPLVIMAWASLHPGWVFGRQAGATLSAYIESYTDPSLWTVLRNTVIYSLGAATLSTVLAGTFAWLVERTDMPFRTAIATMLLVPVAIPGVIYGLAFVFLLSPRIGIMNAALTSIFPMEPLNIYSIPGMIVVEGMRLTAGAFFMLSPVIRNMDPTLEEAASASGMGALSKMRFVVVPLLVPGILSAFLYYIVVGVESFDIPALLGGSVGIHVFATKIYYSLHPGAGLPDFSGGIATGMLTLTFAAAMIGLFYWVTKRGDRYVTVAGKNFRSRRRALGKWKYPAVIFTVLYFLFAIGFPLLVLVWSSLLRNIEVPSLAALSKLNFDNYVKLFMGTGTVQWRPPMGRALFNTFFITFVVATVVMVLSLLTSWFVVRSRIRGRRFLDLLTFLPHAIPGIVIGLATLIMYVKLKWLPVYGTIWIIIIAMVSKRLSYGARTMISAMLQLHKELEEAAETSGLNWYTRVRLVTLRLLLPAFINGWLYSAMLSMSMLAIPLILYNKGTETLSIVVFRLWNNADTTMSAAAAVVTVVIMLLMVAVGRYLASKTGVRSDEEPV